MILEKNPAFTKKDKKANPKRDHKSFRPKKLNAKDRYKRV